MSSAVLTLVAAMGLAACGGNPPPGAQSMPEPATVRPGDAIRVAFSREPELNGEFRMDESADVVLPLIGERNLLGVPADSAKRMIEREYESVIRNQSVQVEYLMRVRVLGSVGAPGLYYLDQTMELGDAIALAGGADADGKLDDIRIIRDGTELRADLDVSTRVSTAVRSGDQIIVPKRSWLSRNGAAVLAASIAAIGVIIAAAR